jgi:hypothetical protein
MKKYHSLTMFVAAAGAIAALVTAPLAAAEDGGGGPNNPLLPGCEITGGSSATGGQTTDCASPGNSQLTATPNDLGIMGAEADEGGMFGFGGW